QSGKGVGAVPHVGADAVELADPTDRDGASSMGHAAPHRLEELKKARVALTALAHARIDAFHSHRTAEYGRRRGRVGRRRHVRWNPKVSWADLALVDRDQVALFCDLHSALPKRRDGEVDEGRRHEHARDMQLEAAVEPRRDEQQGGRELARLVPGDLDLAAPDRPEDRHGKAIPRDGGTEPAKRVEQRRDRTFTQARRASDRDVPAAERPKRGAEPRDRPRVPRVDGTAGAVARPGALDDKLFKVPLDAVVQGDDRVDHGVNVLAWIKWTDAQPRTPVRDR